MSTEATFILDEETAGALERIAKRDGLSQADALRQAVLRADAGFAADDRDGDGDGELHSRGCDAACRYLERQGYEIVDRGWECPAGTADIVAYDDGALVFIRVRAVSDLDAGMASEGIGPEARNRWEKIAGWYLRDHDHPNRSVRFDVVSILVLGGERALLRHYVNALSDVA